MEITLARQAFEQFGRAKKILITLPENLSADALASGLALRLFLLKMEKDVVICSSGSAPEAYSFLPGIGELKSAIENSKSLVVEVDTSSKKLDELSYQVAEKKVQIFLKSKSEAFTASDISFAIDKFPVDLVVALDCVSLESLGKLFEKNTDLFYETPKVNIDNRAANEYFGAVNLVDVTATSVAEILASLFEQYEQQLVGEDIATCLLTGIITKTNSFQHAQTTPQSFIKASQLISLGGRQQEIIKAIYKTKPLPLLRLWGRALARLKIIEEKNTIYSLINFSDFEKTESTKELLLPALGELIENVSNYEILCLIAEIGPGQVQLLMAARQQAKLDQAARHFNQSGKITDLGVGQFKVLNLVLSETSLAAVENLFLQTIA